MDVRSGRGLWTDVEAVKMGLPYFADREEPLNIFQQLRCVIR